MPHDKNGVLIEEGDLVNIRARVKTVTTGEEYCNVTLETVEPMFPGTDKNSIVLNAKQVELVGKAAPTEAAAAVSGTTGE
jgi:hypothetical protein